jgi:hypothetical protein
MPLQIEKEVTDALELEQREIYLEGWRAVNVAEHLQGYLLLTSRRLVFVEHRAYPPFYQVVPFLSCRLDNLSKIEVKKRNLMLDRMIFRIARAEPAEVREKIRYVVLLRYQLQHGEDGGAKDPFPGRDRSSPAYKADEVANPEGPLPLIPCHHCGTLNSADYDRCGICGRKLTLVRPGKP